MDLRRCEHLYGMMQCDQERLSATIQHCIDTSAAISLREGPSIDRGTLRLKGMRNEGMRL